MSPSGLSFIGKLTTGEKLLSVQRIILDEKIAYAAENAGATLLDGFEVKVTALLSYVLTATQRILPCKASHLSHIF